ncbi:MAG TPA: hypothetical protein VEY07_06455, partial [Thermoplasmata archaeon]|nr:hypothetical protein [Thermoplasmata archaeon]
HETGLPGGYSWNVTVTSNYYYPQVITRSSTSQNITVRLLAGGVSSYVVSYSVAPPLGYSAVPSHGTVNYTATSNTTGPIVVNITITVIPNTYVLSFNETRLPLGTDWTAVLNGTYNHSVSPSNSFRVPNGSYAYSIGQAGQFVPQPSSGHVNVSGAAVSIPITFTLPPEYPVVFNETGLAPGTQWYVWLGGASVSGNSTSLRFNMTNGTYAYVASATGYYSSAAIGNLTVAGKGVTVVVPFVAAPYTVTFQETGLPNGTYFTVFLNGSGQSGVHAVAFSVPNGTYHYSVYPLPHYSPSPAAGNVTVNGANLTVRIGFNLSGNGTYTVTLLETGLPAATLWSASLGGATTSSTTTSISFVVYPGTYAIAVGNVAGYNATVQSSVDVTNQNVTVGVTFVPSLFTLTFHETGLPLGTGWGIVIGNQIQSSLGPNVTFTVPNGTFGYVVLAVPGFVTHAYGTVSMNDSDQLVIVAFSPQLYPIEFIEFGLPTGSNWSVTVANSTMGFNQTKSSTSNSIVFFLPNGTYTVTFTLPSGYTGSSSSNLVIVAGKAVTGPSVTARALSSTASWGWPGAWTVGAVAVAAAAIGILLGAYLFGRRRPPRGLLSSKIPPEPGALVGSAPSKPPPPRLN